MIPKPLDEITEEDLTNLLTNGVAEKKTIDYKQQLPGTSDSEKKEFLADVSSFANTEGGDLIFGMTESAGVPTGIPGVQIEDTDKTTLRLEQILQSGLSPRIRNSTRTVPLDNGNYVLIIRAERSWYGPHQVISDKKFHGRATNGKYALDVTDLRNAFLFANTVTEKVGAFRAERLMALANDQPLAPLAKGPIVVMHCLPYQSFGSDSRFDVAAISGVQPMLANRVNSYGMRVNFEGSICVGSSASSVIAYTQIFRNGAIEAVGLLKASPQPHDTIPSLLYEEAVVKYLPSCFNVLKKLGCNPPIIVGISLIGVRGLTMGTDPNFQFSNGNSEVIHRDVLELPSIIVTDFSAPLSPLLKPSLDVVWNACGYRASPYFDPTGKWIGR